MTEEEEIELYGSTKKELVELYEQAIANLMQQTGWSRLATIKAMILDGMNATRGNVRSENWKNHKQFLRGMLFLTDMAEREASRLAA